MTGGAEARGDVLTRYAPSGRVSARASLVLPVALAAAFALGLGYQALLLASPFVLLHWLVPFALGLALAAVGIAALQLGKVRNARVVPLLALALAATALGAVWWHLLATGLAPAQHAGLRVLAWVLEALVVLALAWAVLRSWFRRAVYCEDEQRYLPRRLLGSAWGCELITLRRAAGERGVDALLELGLRAVPGNEHEGEYRFWLREGASGRWMTLWWHGSLENLRGKRQRRDVLVLRRVRVDDAFVEGLRARISASA